MINRRCFACGKEKPLDEFHLAKRGKAGRASKCKECISEWHSANYRKKVLADPDFMKANCDKAKGVYAAMTPEDKKGLMRKISERRTLLPNAALSKNLRRALRRRPTENHVTLDELLAIWNDQSGKCAVSGIVMTWGQGAYKATSMSIDRIDCEQGYTRENVRLVCFQVNAFRGRWSDAEMLVMAKAIVANMERDVIPFTFVA